MTVDLHEMNDEQFERLLKLTGGQLSIPPMRNVVVTTLASIRSEQAAVQAAEPAPSRWRGWSRERVIRRSSTPSYSSFGELPRSRWKDLGILVGGVGAAAIVTLILLLVFRGFGADDSRRDAEQGQAPPAAAAFSDPALAASMLMVQAGESAGLLLSDTAVVPVDPATGAPVPGYTPIPGSGPQFAPAVTSEDGQVYFASFESFSSVCEPMSGGSACRGSADVLHLVEATSWTDRSATLPGDSWVAGDAFSSDGRRYAVVLSSSTTHTLLLFDPATAALIAEHDLDFRPSLVSFALDDAALIVFGQPLGSSPGVDQPGPPQVQALDAETLEPAWDHTFDDMLMGSWCVSGCSGSHETWESVSWTPGVSASPDGRSLVAVHADRDVITRVDLSTGDVSTLELRRDTAWYQGIASLFIAEAEAKGETDATRRETTWSLDGTRLYILTIDSNATRQLQDDTAVLQLVDPESGRILQDRSINGATDLALSSDTGDVLIEGMRVPSGEGDAGRLTMVLDAETFESIADLDQWQLEVLHTLDGRPLLLAQRGGYENAELALIHLETYTIVSAWAVAPGQCFVAGHWPICDTN